jgi:hypothetical protein
MIDVADGDHRAPNVPDGTGITFEEVEQHSKTNSDEACFLQLANGNMKRKPGTLGFRSHCSSPAVPLARLGRRQTVGDGYTPEFLRTLEGGPHSK